MYDWLSESLQGSSQVVTANRRLAAALADNYGQRQIEAGRRAWESPAIRAWPDWLGELVAAADLSETLPTRLNGHQGRVVWEECLRHELSTPLVNTAAIVRQAREAWTRLLDFGVPLDSVASAARGRDQQIFARAAQRYAQTLADRNWVDEAGVGRLVMQSIAEGKIAVPERIAVAGFDRPTPAVTALFEALENAGCRVQYVEGRAPAGQRYLANCENPDAEMRAAGAWARDLLLEAPEKSVAIVAANLEKDAARRARLVREGIAPGWQMGGERHRLAVNVSYGSKLNTYPAIAVALLALRWLHEDISSSELARLLRSPAIGRGELGDRSRMELDLRGYPAMSWTPSRSAKALRRKSVRAADWLQRIAGLEGMRSGTQENMPPSAWAAHFDALLQQLNWPGDATLSSNEFQLQNRWRELLNDLARLDLVVPSMSLGAALRRVHILAAEAVFQPENRQGLIQLIGPLEASGMEFDRLWVSGLTSSDWPPPSRPSALLSRDLQREYGLPDADPQDTVDYARGVLDRLARSAAETVLSYAEMDGDTEQRPSALLATLGSLEELPVDDPGWYAKQLVEQGAPLPVRRDTVPRVSADEVISGGSTTLSYQLHEPIAAFAFGRLGVRPLPGITSGLPANLRGNIIHRALNAMYRDLPARDEIADMIGGRLEEEFPGILRHAFGWLEAKADPVLGRLLTLEKSRVRNLLLAVAEQDSQRADFTVAGLEADVRFISGAVQVDLRIDRVDRLPGGLLRIIDYKTGQRRQFLGSDKEPSDAQLVIYACALDAGISDLAFFNVDSRHVDINGAGLELTPDLDWDTALARWKDAIHAAAGDFERGDVRINGEIPARDSRAFGLLSRVRELTRER